MALKMEWKKSKFSDIRTEDELYRKEEKIYLKLKYFIT